MSEGKFKKLIEEVRESLGKIEGIDAIVVFGSVAKGEVDERSDLDLFVVVQNKEAEKKAWDKLLELEGKYNQNIQIIFADSGLSKLERNFLETILREGKLIYGKLPEVSVARLKLEPYAILFYDLSPLQISQKKKMNRILYGKKSEKRYKGKKYTSEKKGLIAELKGWRTGIASIMIPEKKSWTIEKILKKEGAVVRRLPIWMAKP